MSLAGIMKFESSVDKARENLKVVIDNLTLIARFKRFTQSANLIQRKFRAQTSSRAAKIDVLHNFWNHLLFDINMKAIKRKDTRIMELCKLIMRVPHSVKYEILKKFVQ